VRKIYLITGILFIALLWIGCGENQNSSAKELREAEQAITDEYLDALRDSIPNLEAQESGIYYIEYEAGEGDSIEDGDEVEVYYYGMMCDSLIFDANIYGDVEGGDVPDFENVIYYDPFSFTVGAGEVISGWDLAALNMKEGGVAQWIIPESLGYGAYPTSSYIRSYATLVFFVKIYKVHPSE